MSQPLSVNEALDGLNDFAETDICVRGILHFEFEDVAIYHWPHAESRPDYESSIWIETGSGSLAFDEEICQRLHGKVVVVAGILYKPDPTFGGGHMGLWPAEILARTVERV